MEHRIKGAAGGTHFKINSMNVKVPSLFQVYRISANGKELSYPMKLSGGNFVFVVRADVSAAPLDLEEALSSAIKQRYSLS